MTQQRQIGIVVVSGSLLIPIMTYVYSKLWMARLASENSNPNQGAMVQAYFAVCASIVVGLVILCFGIVLFIRGRRKQPHQSTQRIGSHGSPTA